MATINFKSVGTTRQERIATTLSSSLVPIGISTPLQLGDTDLFKMNTSLAATVNDNLRNLILTNWGERLLQFDFGGNLRSILADMSSQDDFDSRAVVNIKGAVTKWMPFVSLQSFESKIDHAENANANGLSVINITITYNVPSLQIFNRNLQIQLYVM